MAHVEAGGGGTGEEVGEYGEAAAAAAAADGGEAAAAAAADGGDGAPFIAPNTHGEKEREPGSVPLHTRTAEGGKTITMISHLETPLPDSIFGTPIKSV